MGDGRMTCPTEGCYQTFRLGARCPLCWKFKITWTQELTETEMAILSEHWDGYFTAELV